MSGKTPDAQLHEGEYDPERHAGLYGVRRFQAMSAVLLALVLSVLDYAIANVALPTIAQDLHTSPSRAIWVVNAYQLANLSCLLPLAAIGGRIGFARMNQLGLIIFMIASVACALSQSILELTLARALQGVGGACIMSVNIGLVRFIYPHRLLGRGIALNGLFVGLGVATGPTLGAFILARAGWPWIFWINLPLGLAAFILSVLAMPKTPRSPHPVDIQGGILTVLAFAVTGLGLDSLMHADFWPGTTLTLTGIGFWIWLLRWQKAHHEPIVPVDLLARRPFFIACLVSFCGFVASNLYIVAMPFSLVDTFHRSTTMVGLLIAPWAAGVAIMSFLVGRVSDRIPATILSSLGLMVTGTAFALLWLLPPEATNAMIAWRTLLGGLGFGLFQPPNNRAIMVTAPPGREAGASGMLSVSRLSGQTIGAFLVAGIFTVFSHPAFLCLGAASFVAFLGASLSAGRGLFRPRRLITQNSTRP
ncbi:MFS transporter [Oecophyllibacter saccharovorans]|uniref:MFS transporter n=1 Tax=Oecophyllibacter saccharovorans TaxID=2558360 RepID=UPI0011433EB7|nr:MFS transporter [Oecophyllibacter saccharovorans]QDH14572.1 MFS transporter [Oecophyllibacter saccharovorans]